MKSISEVLTRLDTIIEWAKENNSPLGYFPVIYRITTAGVQRGVEQCDFDDCPRMETLDVLFAQRYFDAFHAWQAGQTTTKAWETAFHAAGNPQITVLQHIVLGMNAHINLDLGIAAALTCPHNIQELKSDFNRINTIIASLIDQVQDRLADIFPPFRLLDRLLQSHDERMANRIIQLARAGAWEAATTLAGLPEAEHPPLIRQLDAGVATLAREIQVPGNWIVPALRLIRWGEQGSVRSKIEKLQHHITHPDDQNQLG